MFDREAEMSALLGYVESKIPGVLITGFRRVGKTSVLKTILNEKVDNYVYIDMRDLGSKGSISKKDVITKFQNSLNEFLRKNRSTKQTLIDNLKNISGVSGFGVGVQFGWQSGRDVDLAQTFKEVNEWAKESETVVVLAIDEAQIFTQAKHYNVAGVFASIYDNCHNIVLVLSGSAFRLLYDFIDSENPDSDLFGRDFEEIKVPPLTKAQSKDLLRQGFTELGKGFEKQSDFDGIIDEAVSKLDGIIGWLIMFGARCNSQGKVSKNYISTIQKQGAALTGQEFVTFLKYRIGEKRYKIIMKLIANSPSTWTEIKTELCSKDRKVSDSNISLLIETLVKNGFLDSDEKAKQYFIPDPLLQFFFK